MVNEAPGLRDAVRMHRTFTAPRGRVFAAWTDPEELKEWFSPSHEHRVSAVEMDLRVGGKYRIEVQDRKGIRYVVGGTFLEIRPPEKLVFTWRWDGPADDGESMVSVEFRSRGEKTDVFLVHNQISPKSKGEYEWGWSGAFDKLSQRLTVSH